MHDLIRSHEHCKRDDMMAKQGMKRPNRTHVRPRNEMPSVPELQDKSRSSGEPANPVGFTRKSAHTERPISNVYPAIDNGLAWNNVKNGLSVADVHDL